MRTRSTAILATVLVALTACSKTDDRATSTSGGSINPAPVPPPASAPTTVTRRLAENTTFELRALNRITTRSDTVGARVRAVSTAAVKDAQNNEVIPAGAEFTGRVTAIEHARTANAPGTLRVDFNSVTVGGQSRPVSLLIITMNTRRDSRPINAGDAAKVGAGAVVGGVAGRVIGGNRTGTIVGATAGAAAGAVVAQQTHDVDIILDSGATMEARLTQPFARTIAIR